MSPAVPPRDLPATILQDLVALRRDIHAHPELAFTEVRTSDLVARTLTGWGIPFERGLARTGIVATIRAGTSPRAIGLRCDMDALPITECTGHAHASTREGLMHACGHDGHTAMLLGAAYNLSHGARFDGTVHLIFQPAEENEGGGRVMVDEGLFDRFPVEAVYGLHNWPTVAESTFAVHTGPAMAAVDLFRIELTGTGAHAAMPQLGDDPVVAIAELVTALQTVVSRATDPAEAVVLSVTQVHAGNTLNVVPPSAVLQGTCRYFTAAISHVVEGRIRRLVDGLASAHGLTAGVTYDRRCPAVINTEGPARLAALAAADAVGADHVHTGLPPSMGCEDFAYMLNATPGCYVWIGNGPGDDGCLLHSNRYDFNDRLIPIGVRYWTALVERCLPLPGA